MGECRLAEGAECFGRGVVVQFVVRTQQKLSINLPGNSV